MISGRDKKPPHLAGDSILVLCPKNYASTGASTGHESAQAPQSMQVSASITYLPSPSEIAPVGHSAAQAPQAMQSSEILYAIGLYLL
jgi:hypothetical protein